jgi:hypothetical protein
MAVDQERNQEYPTDEGVWSRCEITWQRHYGSCSWVAVIQDPQSEEMVRSPLFRWRRNGAPTETAQAVSSLAALEEWLVSEGWELVDEPRDAWYALHFRRPILPLTQRNAPFRADAALISLVGLPPGPAPADARPRTIDPVTPEVERIERAEPPRPVRKRTRPQGEVDGVAATERAKEERSKAERLAAERLEAELLEAKRLESERLEAARLEAELLEAERLQAERLKAARLEAARLEAERLEAERLEAERLEAERAEAERLEAERLEAERLAAEEEYPLRDLIQSYATVLDADLDVRRLYGGPGPQLEPDRFERTYRRRRR